MAGNVSELFDLMVSFFEGDPRRIQHFVKVHAFAAHIGRGEGIDPSTLLVLEAAAIVHDAGIKPAEERYGRSDGKLQELEGPPVARPMLVQAGFCQADIDRICFLIAHHHTYDPIDGMDHRILVEADFLVNLFEDGVPARGIARCIEKTFATKTGTMLARTMFGIV